MRGLRRYLLFQIPGLLTLVFLSFVASRHFDLPRWIYPVGLAAWIAKDLLIYPRVRKSFERGKEGALDRLVETRAVVKRALSPEGWVEAGGELWRARSTGAAIAAGVAVRVIAVDALTLVVDVEGRKQEEPDEA